MNFVYQPKSTQHIPRALSLARNTFSNASFSIHRLCQLQPFELSCLLLEGVAMACLGDTLAPSTSTLPFYCTSKLSRYVTLVDLRPDSMGIRRCDLKSPTEEISTGLQCLVPRNDCAYWLSDHGHGPSNALYSSDGSPRVSASCAQTPRCNWTNYVGSNPDVHIRTYDSMASRSLGPFGVTR